MYTMFSPGKFLRKNINKEVSYVRNLVVDFPDSIIQWLV